MTNFSVHLLFFFVFCCSFLFSVVLFCFLLFFDPVVMLSFRLFDRWFYNLKVCFYLDWMSSLFSAIVLIISSIIMVYSYNYMSPYSKPLPFLWLTSLFVISMLIVIFMPNLFFAILGWDGLGLVSFFLIVYYQNTSSTLSGVFTLLMNRLGDRFFLVSLFLLFYSSKDFTFFSSSLVFFFTSLILVLTFITKRAIYPFSPWLPLAIAAPTPISALVHSSTLVTAGLFLIMRFSYYFYSCPTLTSVLLVVSIFTSLYAGLNSLFEQDLKKLIALSTLSHLGFICMAFSCGLLTLSFFHLLVHALFKSLLFMCMGDIIINVSHSQDIRYLSSGRVSTPSSSFIMIVSLLNLLGIPNLRGFFSKDLVLETMSYSSLSYLVVLFLYINVIFTYVYTYKLMSYSISRVKYVPYMNVHFLTPFHTLLMFCLSLVTLWFASFFLFSVCFDILYLSVPSSVKNLPIVLNTIVFLCLFTFLCLPYLRSKFVMSLSSSMLFLSPVLIRAPSLFYTNLVTPFLKSTEYGAFNFVPNFLFPVVSHSISSSVFFSLVRVNHMLFVSFFLFVLFFVLS